MTRALVWSVAHAGASAPPVMVWLLHFQAGQAAISTEWTNSRATMLGKLHVTIMHQTTGDRQQPLGL